MTGGHECPDCGEHVRPFEGCACPHPGEHCSWCGGRLDGELPECRCPPEDDDDWADREERRRERQAQYAAEDAAMTPEERAMDGA